MLSPKDMKERLQSLTPKSRRTFMLLEQHGHNVDAMLAAHPDITPQDVDELCDETIKNMQDVFVKALRSGPPGQRRKKAKPGTAYQFKITLRGSKPPIWRRVVVPGDITVGHLHAVIQAAMGWTNSHLHLFEIDGQQYQDAATEDCEDMGFEDESEYLLHEVLPKAKMKFRYEYDFGDGWEHVVVLEKIIPAASPPTIVCTAGKGRCPFEDCGGIYGYYDMLAILADPKHPDHTQTLEWAGEVPDPEEFDIAEANARLAEM